MPDIVREFAATAAGFCAWCASPGGAPHADLRAAMRHLSRLIALAQDLPRDVDAPDIDGFRCEDALWRAIRSRFATLPFNYYSVVLEPHDLVAPDTAIGDVADDLADIFRDLDEGLGLLRAGHVDAAVWHWVSTHDYHWGKHAVEALWALHRWREGCAGNGAGGRG